MRSRILCSIILIVSVLFCWASEVQARLWTSANGEFKFKASVVAIGKGAVRLRLAEDGSVHDLPWAALSTADQKFLHQNARRYGVTGTPEDVFHAYQAAVVRARSLGQVKKFFSRRKLDWWKEFDTDEKKELASLKRFYISEAFVLDESIDGNEAVVKVRGNGRTSSGKIKTTYAKFKMVKERGAWKIDSKNTAIGGHGVILVPSR